MPSLFIGHGTPMNALSDNVFTQEWRALSARFEKPRAILCVSAHWETEGTRVTAQENPPTIHDFYGFPPALFAMSYNAPGATELPARLAALTKGAIQPSVEWGFDHGAWSVLKFLYEAADVPVAQLSLDVRKNGVEHYALAQSLAPLRDEGVLILGSGNIVHNLRYFDRRNDAPLAWASAFNDIAKAKILGRDHTALMNYASLSADVAMSIPTPEHYLPLLYVLGASHDGEKIEVHTDVVQSALAMTSVSAGLN